MPFIRVRLAGRKRAPYEANPKTLGEHLKKERVERHLLQREVASLIGACPAAYLHWEKDQSEPPVSFYPAIIRFLGYVPWREPESRQERMLQFRRRHGWSMEHAAKQAGVDEGTWGRWEKADQSELPSIFPQPSWTKIEVILSGHYLA